MCTINQQPIDNAKSTKSIGLFFLWKNFFSPTMITIYKEINFYFQGLL